MEEIADACDSAGAGGCADVLSGVMRQPCAKIRQRKRGQHRQGNLACAVVGQEMEKIVQVEAVGFHGFGGDTTFALQPVTPARDGGEGVCGEGERVGGVGHALHHLNKYRHPSKSRNDGLNSFIRLYFAGKIF